MKKISLIIIALFFCFQDNGFGQIPKITISPSNLPVDSVSLHIFKGLFRVDSISDIGKAYLITVVSVDTLETTSPALSILTAVGTPFTIVSFKNETIGKDRVISKGEVFKFTLSPPDGIWTLYGGKGDDWGLCQTVRDSMDTIIKVPLPRIKTQLMLSQELKGLQYIESNTMD